jgi:hypothetical protein
MAQPSAILEQATASSRRRAEERYRTNASPARAREGAETCSARLLALARRSWPVYLALCALGGTVEAQVKLTLQGDVPAVGPGTKYPAILACNNTNLPQQVQGWKFKTKDYAGFTTWMQPFSHAGTGPVEYTQGIPETEQQMRSGSCRVAATDYTGTLTAGQDATPFDLQSLIKTGSCTELPPYKDAAPLTCSDLDGAGKPDYTAGKCLVDEIGANGGDTYGGFVSTFSGQTELQVAIPPGTFSISSTDVKWNPYRMGPQYMMAVSMAQEILNVDMQWLIAVAGKETGAGMVNVGNNQVRSEDGSYHDNGTYSYWQIEQDTYGTYIMAYPQFFPKYGPCAAKYPDATSAISVGRCAEQSWGEASEFYLQPPGHDKMMPNSPQIVNGAFSSSIAWYNLYDALANSPDLCFLDAIQNGKDKRIALAAMIGGYNQGRYTDFAGPLKKPELKDDPLASTRFTEGNNFYRRDIYIILDQLINASKATCASRVLYDTSITLNEVQRFLFGGNDAAGTPAKQADGGLLLHYDMSAQDRADLWTDVQCAFGKLKGKAPSMAGKDAISFRYDWLTLLRVVKKHLPFNIQQRKLPVEPDFQHVIKMYSTGTRTCSGKVLDTQYPSMTITSPAANSVVSPVVTPGAHFTFTATDNISVDKADWSLDSNWLAWQPAAKVSGNNYEFYVPCETPGYPKKGKKAALWIRSTDGCGNSTVQQFDFTTHSTMNCGDPPVPPQVATPLATPNGREFSALSPGVNVTLTVATPGASILYTTDGTDPDSVVGGATKQYAGTAIPITATTTLKARGVMDGMGASAVMTEVYTKVEPGKVATPTANPAGRNFTGTLSVTLTSATAGAAVYYTTDGTAPTASSTRFGAPIALTANTVIKAIAIKEGMYPSDVMTETYSNIPPVGVKQAWYLDENGDGRIEKAVVVFASALNGAPEKLGFTIQSEDGKTYAKTPAGAEIKLAAGDAARAVVTFADPFPFGVTSLKNAATSGQTFRQDAIPLVDGAFAVADSVAPVIASAEVKEPGDGDALKRVLITFSEPVNDPADGSVLVFKRGPAETPAAQVLFAGVVKTGDRDYAFKVDSNTTFFPIAGDSVAITTDGRTHDLAGRAPAVKLFRKMGGNPPKAKPVSLTVTFPNGSAKDPAGGAMAANPANVVFIPVDKDGNVLPGQCGGCVPKDSRGFVGPVFHIQTPGPVRYQFRIFNTLGEFVAEGEGQVTDNDLKSLRPGHDSRGVYYEAPVVWTGATRSGNRAGTGAYILKATFFTGTDPVTGAAPAQFTEKKVFGLLRTLGG